jgi:integrase
MGRAEVEAFLTYLAVTRRVGASTQNQALSALLFLYGKVLMLDLPWLAGIVRARKPSRRPTVLAQSVMPRLLAEVRDPELGLIVGLLYGSGLRLGEALDLRLKDVDFEAGCLHIRGAKNNKDRQALLPQSLVESLRCRVAWCLALHATELRAGRGTAPPARSLRRRRTRLAPVGLAVRVPGARSSFAARGGEPRRGHVDARRVQRAVRAAVLDQAVDVGLEAGEALVEFARELAGN